MRVVEIDLQGVVETVEETGETNSHCQLDDLSFVEPGAQLHKYGVAHRCGIFTYRAGVVADQPVRFVEAGAVRFQYPFGCFMRQAGIVQSHRMTADAVTAFVQAGHGDDGDLDVTRQHRPVLGEATHERIQVNQRLWAVRRDTFPGRVCDLRRQYIDLYLAYTGHSGLP